MCKLRTGITEPSPQNWIRLQAFIGPYLCHLSLDFSTIYPRSIIPIVAESCPDLNFPRLRTLNIAIDHTGNQLKLAKRFMQKSVTAFNIEVFLPTTMPWIRRPPRRCPRSLTLFEALLESTAPRELSHNEPNYEDAYPPNFLVDLCGLISGRMPRLTILEFIIEDAAESIALGSIQPTVDMILGLPSLELLKLPPSTAVPRVLQKISSHPTLRGILQYMSDWPIYAITAYDGNFWADYDGWNSLATSAMVLGADAFRSLNKLEIVGEVHSISESVKHFPPSALPCLSSLRICTDIFAVDGGEDVEDLFQAIAVRFPALESFRIGMLRLIGATYAALESWQVTPTTLAPFRFLTKLHTLIITTECCSSISATTWLDLLPSWPNLQTLILDNTPCNVSLAPAFPLGPAPLDIVLNAFTKHCPHLTALSLHVERVLVTEQPWVPVCPRLDVLELVIPGSSEIDGSTEEDLAEYLKAVLPPTCSLHVMCELNKGLDVTLAPSDLELKDCRLDSTLKAWSDLHASEGTTCVPQYHPSTQADVLRPLRSRG